jgi:hypothetical protein
VTKITMIGVDLAKSVFHLHATSMAGEPKFRKKLSRQSFSRFMAEQPPALVIMEACGSAHYWAQEMIRLGHEVKLPDTVLPHPASTLFCRASGQSASRQPSHHRRLPGHIPIDRQHIEAVFADGSAGAENAPDRNARGFVEKTFEILLRVPPPLLSNWQTFFSQQLTNAFGKKIAPRVSYRIIRLFELYQTIHPAAINPRAIKSYINKVISQAKLSGDSVPLEYQALYVLYKDTISADIKRLQDSTALDPPIRATEINPDWTKYLAAAHYNVLPEDALAVR